MRGDYSKYSKGWYSQGIHGMGSEGTQDYRNETDRIIKSLAAEVAEVAAIIKAQKEMPAHLPTKPKKVSTEKQEGEEESS
jgi:hypothetical protein